MVPGALSATGSGSYKSEPAGLPSSQHSNYHQPHLQNASGSFRRLLPSPEPGPPGHTWWREASAGPGDQAGGQVGSLGPQALAAASDTPWAVSSASTLSR